MGERGILEQICCSAPVSKQLVCQAREESVCAWGRGWGSDWQNGQVPVLGTLGSDPEAERRNLGWAA